GALAQRYLQPRHHIREVAATPITVHRPCERLAVALAATWVGIDHGVSCSGVHLEFVEEIMSILRVGAAMNVQQCWVALSWLTAVWLQDPAIERAAGALVAPPFWPGERHFCLPLPVEIGQLLLSRAIGVAEKHLWGRYRSRGRKGAVRAVLGTREPRHLALARDDALGHGVTRSPHTVDGHIPLIHDGKRDPGTVG